MCIPVGEQWQELFLQAGHKTANHCLTAHRGLFQYVLFSLRRGIILMPKAKETKAESLSRRLLLKLMELFKADFKV